MFASLLRRRGSARLLLGIAAVVIATASPLIAKPTSGTSGKLLSPDQTPEGLTGSDWDSIRAAHTAWRHNILPVKGQPGTWQARNLRQQWTTRFDRGGFLTTPIGAGWQWGLELRRYGFGAEQTAVSAEPQVNTEGGRISYRRDALMQEWFVNDERGLEHGFVLQQRPAGARPGTPLEVVLGVRGGLLPGLSADGQTVHFRDESGAPIVNYGALKVWDADEKELVSRFAIGTCNTIVLQVEESTARYPLTIDPIAQQAYLKPAAVNVWQNDDQFGLSVAVTVDTVVVGVPGEDSSTTGINSTPNEEASDAGAAYVFIRGPAWSQLAYLKAGQVSANDNFGISVAVTGERLTGITVVVGANREDSSRAGISSTPNEEASDAGAAYVFSHAGGGASFQQEAYLKASQVSAKDNFGSSVAVTVGVSENDFLKVTVVVGANGEDSGATGINSLPDESAADSGAAYVFTRPLLGPWSQEAFLKASHVSAGDSFGTSVALHGETIVVGAPGEDSSTTGVNSLPDEDASNAGAAFVFMRSGTSWHAQAYLKAGQVSAEDSFGASVAVRSIVVVIGAPFEDSSTSGVNSIPDELATNAGAAYVFMRSGEVWSPQAYLKAGQVSGGDLFGSSVAADGLAVIVGAPGDDSSTTGINSTPNEEASNAGAAYVFELNGTTWTWSQKAYLKASQVSAGDLFGSSVAVSADIAVVGVPFEDSSTGTAVLSEPDELAQNAGAVCVFQRSSLSWGGNSPAAQISYLKHKNYAFDTFGASVAMSGSTVVVGAYLEDSSSTGVDSTPDESASEAGAAYVFVQSGTTWSQQAYLKASEVSAGDMFGSSVAVNGDTVIVGAPRAAQKGKAYVFVRSGTRWNQQAFLEASHGPAFDYFGGSVAVSGNTVVIGAALEDSSTTGVNSTPDALAMNSGAAYVFVRSGATWSQQAYLKASQVSANDYFGGSVAVSDNTVVIGAHLEDGSTTGVNSAPDEQAMNSGAAYVFVRNGATWSQQAYLKASQVSPEDNFGSVAVSGETVVVGAPGEDSSTAGVNSVPDELAMNSGAAYVFVRSGATWSQQAYLKASQVSPEDNFGSVAVSGETVIVGARGEDSSTTGVNSTPNESGQNSGAAYVFLRRGTTWRQQAYLKASQALGGDNFGSVAVSGEMVVVGASSEGSSTAGVNSTPNGFIIGAGAAYIFTGFAPAPQIAVSGNGRNIAIGDATPASADHTDFGGAAVTGGGVERTFTITNSNPFYSLALTGTPRVVLTGSSAFSVTTQPAATVTENGGRTSFTIAYDPGAVGPDNATVSIASDDPDDSPFTFVITGTGRNSKSPLELWREVHFGIAFNGGDGADEADPDSDGLVNLIEWACGLDPTSGTGAPISLTRIGTSLRFTYTRSVAAVNAGVNFRVELLDPPESQTWRPVLAAHQVASNDGTVQVVRVTVPDGNRPLRLFRLSVTTPPS